MNTLRPRSFIERRFKAKAVSMLPLDTAKLTRNDFGVLGYEWVSPCAEFGSLWVCPRDYEVYVANRITHEHFEPYHYRWQNFSRRKSQRMAVFDAIQLVSAIMKGKVAAVRWADAGSSGFRAIDAFLAERAEHGRESPERPLPQAWTFFGEVEG